MSNVLNGYLFAVIGLYDLSQVTTETVYDDYFTEAVATVKALVSHYDLTAMSKTRSDTELDIFFLRGSQLVDTSTHSRGDFKA